MTQTGWSTRRLKLALGAGGALLLVLLVWLSRQLQPEIVTEDVPPVASESAIAAESRSPSGEVTPMADPATGDMPEQSATPWADNSIFAGTSEVLDLDQTLAEAAEALAAGRLVEPIDDSALQRYLSVLSADPENEIAAAGLTTVAEQLLSNISALLEDRQLDEAARLFPALNQTLPEDPRREQLAARLKQLKRGQELAVSVAQNLAAGRLRMPPQRNALARARQLIQVDSEHPQLDDLLASVEQALIDRAQTLVEQREFDAADDWLAQASSLRAESLVVIEGTAAIESAKQREYVALERAIDVACNDFDFRAAASHLVQAEQLGAPLALVERGRARIERGERYGNLRPGQVVSDPLASGGIGPALVVMPHGQFMMGSPSGEPGHRPNEEPRTRVRLERGFALGKTEVTLAQFARFINASGYQTSAEELGYSYRYFEKSGRLSRARKITWRDNFEGREAKPDEPVIHVSWRDAQAYVDWLTAQTGEVYRLPTEAEFEYALRAGGDTRFWWGSGNPEQAVENLTGDQDKSRRRTEWSKAIKGYGDGHWGPAPVASFVANPFGLYDMAGNVAEWVEDCWHDSYVRAPNDGSAWVNRGCQQRVVRGGFWGGAPESYRSAYRSGYSPAQRGGAIGFRVARDLPGALSDVQLAGDSNR